jgi:hypothetical protein
MFATTDFLAPFYFNRRIIARGRVHPVEKDGIKTILPFFLFLLSIGPPSPIQAAVARRALPPFMASSGPHGRRSWIVPRSQSPHDHYSTYAPPCIYMELLRAWEEAGATQRLAGRRWRASQAPRRCHWHVGFKWAGGVIRNYPPDREASCQWWRLPTHCNGIARENTIKKSYNFFLILDFCCIHFPYFILFCLQWFLIKLVVL